MSSIIDSVKTAISYHHRTKHHLHRYARGPHGLDWDNQLDPFRTYNVEKQILLPIMPFTTHYESVSVSRPLEQRQFRDIASRNYRNSSIPFTLSSISALLELSMGVSAWKQYKSTENTWALRCNPSSGNLHPTETYVIVDKLEDDSVPCGVYHYMSRNHVLEQRCRISSSLALPSHSILIGLSSIFWRESWKYGERAFRYCNHDAGHAIGALSYAASTLGWTCHLQPFFNDSHIASLLGLDRKNDYINVEQEHLDMILLISKNSSNERVIIDNPNSVNDIVSKAMNGSWSGTANRLSPQGPVAWSVIDDVAAACYRDNKSPLFPSHSNYLKYNEHLPPLVQLTAPTSAIQIIKQRRSAQSFDGVTSMHVESFYRILDATLPRDDTPPWNTINFQLFPPRTHLLLFVHRVIGLPQGLYLFLRNTNSEAMLREALIKHRWVSVTSIPSVDQSLLPSSLHQHLYLLHEYDYGDVSAKVSCNQDIARDGAFSLGMLTEFESILTLNNPWLYRLLFWECGMIGQVLYLEAEAAGVRGTGIGCFFDDAVHSLCHLKERNYDQWPLQSFYHFTVGGAVEDRRITTLSPYHHLQNRIINLM